MSSYATWNQYTAYAIGDVVSYAGQNYVATTPNLNVPPFPVTPDWSLLTPPLPPGSVTNPLTADLLGAGFDIQNIGTTESLTFYGTNVGTEFLTLPPPSLATRISVGNALEVNPVDGITATRFLAVAPQTSIAPTVGDDLCNKSYTDTKLSNPPGVDIIMAGNSIQQAGTLQTNFLTLPGGGFANPTLDITSPLRITDPTVPAQFTLPPQTAVAPTVPNDITNKTYVDAYVKFRDTTEFWVSNNGVVSGDGSLLNPFQTVQAAITAAEVISSAANICVINIASGHYTGNLTFTKGYVMLAGVLSTQTANEITELTGSITISCAGAADLFNRQVVFQGLNITCGVGQNCTDNSTTSHLVSFQDCKIFSNGRFFNGISTGADARTYFTNCEISQTNAAITDSTIYVNRGAVEIERLDITTDGNAPCLEIAGNAVVFRCSLSTFEVTNASATVAPICLITTSSVSAQPFGQTTFTYTSATSKAASPTSSAIRIASGVGTILILLNNYYTMTGLIGSGNNVITYNGVGSPTLLMNENRSLFIPVAAAYSFTIQAGITKVNYTDINPVASGSFLSTATQTIATAGTPQLATFNTSVYSFNTLLVAGTRLTALATGNFRLMYRIQWTQTSGSDAQCEAFFRVNGTAVTNSASRVTVKNNDFITMTVENIISLTVGQYVEVMLNSTTNTAQAIALPVAGSVPATASVVANLIQISDRP